MATLGSHTPLIIPPFLTAPETTMWPDTRFTITFSSYPSKIDVSPRPRAHGPKPPTSLSRGGGNPKKSLKNASPQKRSQRSLYARLRVRFRPQRHQNECKTERKWSPDALQKRPRMQTRAKTVKYQICAIFTILQPHRPPQKIDVFRSFGELYFLTFRSFS